METYSKSNVENCEENEDSKTLNKVDEFKDTSDKVDVLNNINNGEIVTPQGGGTTHLLYMTTGVAIGAILCFVILKLQNKNKVPL